jgi:hypothetical protein
VTPAEALQCILLAAKDEKVQLTKTTQGRLLYLTDLRALRHGSELTSGLVWERADHGPFNRSVGFLTRKVEVDLVQYAEYRDHASAVVAAYARVGNDALGMVCKGSAPMRKAPNRGDVLNLRAESTNDTSAPVTYPQT